ncbi:MAG: hypothetical protein ACLURV_11275 [Gallintestinimicrobium sp.]
MREPMHMKSCSVPIAELWAHVDDSTAFQVYQNLAEEGKQHRLSRKLRTGIILRGGAGADLLLFHILRLWYGFVGLAGTQAKHIRICVHRRSTKETWS